MNPSMVEEPQTDTATFLDTAGLSSKIYLRFLYEIRLHNVHEFENLRFGVRQCYAQESK